MTSPLSPFHTKLRSGKWTPEESEYADALIKEFKAGSLMDLTEGTSMRGFLAKKLKCFAKRVSKKFENSNYNGKQQYVKDKSLSPQEIVHRRVRLDQLERAFLQSLEDAEWGKQDGRITAHDVLATRNYGWAHPHHDIPANNAFPGKLTLAHPTGKKPSSSGGGSGSKWGDSLAADAGTTAALEQSSSLFSGASASAAECVTGGYGGTRPLLTSSILDRELLSSRLGASSTFDNRGASSLFPTIRSILPEACMHQSTSELALRQAELMRGTTGLTSTNFAEINSGLSGSLHGSMEQEAYLRQLRELRQQREFLEEQQWKRILGHGDAGSHSIPSSAMLARHHPDSAISSNGVAGLSSSLLGGSSSGVHGADALRLELELEDFQRRQQTQAMSLTSDHRHQSLVAMERRQQLQQLGLLPTTSAWSRSSLVEGSRMRSLLRTRSEMEEKEDFGTTMSASLSTNTSSNLSASFSRTSGNKKARYSK